MGNSVKVLLTDNIAPQALEVFAEYPDIDADSVGTLDPDELKGRIGDYDAVIVRSPTKLTRDIIEAGRRLKYIGRAGVGVDNIDVAAATDKNITVMNSPGGNTVSTAEHSIAMLMALAHRVAQGDRSLRDGKWDRKNLKGVELSGKTLGVVGLGRVGREVAHRMLAFDMKVLGFDPFVSDEDMRTLGVTPAALDDLLSQSNFITIHVPLGDKTRGLISSDEIARMRNGVFVVNCARGGIVDENAALAGLESGKIAGVAFDVFEEEPLPAGHGLLEHERSVFTPHLGAATADAQVRVAVDVSKHVAQALTGGDVIDAVNAP